MEIESSKNDETVYLKLYKGRIGNIVLDDLGGALKK
jgi:hypothetical protein